MLLVSSHVVGMVPLGLSALNFYLDAVSFAGLSLSFVTMTAMHDVSLEGWYTDPYERHEARWMSQGTPTALVKDGKTEGSDPVVDQPFKVAPVRIEAEGPGDGSDQRRADDAQTEEPYHSSEASRAATDVFDQTEGGALPLHCRWTH
jgi:hypothetical protein